MGASPLQSSFPSLYSLSLKKEAMIAELWNPSEGAWNLHLRRHLRDYEILEWALLSHQLSPFSFRDVADSWTWNLSDKGVFSTGSLTINLASLSSPINNDFYSNLWKGPMPKKVKFFIWELSHSCINTTDTIQRRFPGSSLSPSRCSMCGKDGETQIHLFSICEFATTFWDYIQTAFGWKRIQSCYGGIFCMHFSGIFG